MAPPSVFVIWVRLAMSEPTVKVGVVAPTSPVVSVPVKTDEEPLLVVKV